MNLRSKYFDSIRVKPEDDRRRAETQRPCDWAGCEDAGVHKAPKSPNKLSEFSWYCQEHAREFNKNWNYFKDMSDEAVARFQKDARTGHRPTWNMGTHRGAKRKGKKPGSEPLDENFFQDPHSIFDDGPGTQEAQFDHSPRQKLRKAELRALEQLGLDRKATAEDVKNRYKDLVKRHHPDMNDGRRDAEERLRQVIEAYRYLRSVKFC